MCFFCPFSLKRHRCSRTSTMLFSAFFSRVTFLLPQVTSVSRWYRNYGHIGRSILHKSSTNSSLFITQFYCFLIFYYSVIQIRLPFPLSHFTFCIKTIPTYLYFLTFFVLMSSFRSSDFGLFHLLVYSVRWIYCRPNHAKMKITPTLRDIVQNLFAIHSLF